MILKNPIFSKDTLRQLFVPAVIVLVGLSAFALGRLSALGAGQEGLVVHQPAAVAAAGQGGGNVALPPVPPAASAQAGVYVASKNGTKYYLPTCGGAKRINEENKIWFPTQEAAQSSGFEPAANCPGL
jgi:hypothetical protein